MEKRRLSRWLATNPNHRNRQSVAEALEAVNRELQALTAEAFQLVQC